MGADGSRRAVLQSYVRAFSLLLGCLTITGCSLTPGSGPFDENIIAQADFHVEHSGPTLGYDYVLVDVNRRNLPILSMDLPDKETKSFGSEAKEKPKLRLGVGDVVKLTVFESEPGGLLVPEDAEPRPGNFLELPPQRIDENGNISVPYAGTIRAEGKTPVAIGRIVQRKLEARAINPEITVEVVEQNFSRVTVTGDVGEGGVFSLRDSGDRVVDIIAQAGGPTGPDHATFVTLTRNGSRKKVAYQAITEDPKENIFLAPGDIIDVSSEGKSFFAFGAAGSVGEFEFEAEELTLNEAMAKLAGLSEEAADPSQVFIYRTETPPALKKMGADVGKLYKHYDTEVPAVFRVDYRKPDIFFLAKSLKLRDGDIIYVATAASVELDKIFSVLKNVTGEPLGVRYDVNVN